MTLPRGFGAVRLETPKLQCDAVERPREDGRYTMDPVQLLCRALQMAPANYRRFELTPCAIELVHVEAEVAVLDGNDDAIHRSSATSWYTVPELAAAMRWTLTAQGLGVRLSSDEETINVCRDSAEPPVAAPVQ